MVSMVVIMALRTMANETQAFSTKAALEEEGSSSSKYNRRLNGFYMCKMDGRCTKIGCKQSLATVLFSTTNNAISSISTPTKKPPCNITYTNGIRLRVGASVVIVLVLAKFAQFLRDLDHGPFEVDIDLMHRSPRQLVRPIGRGAHSARSGRLSILLVLLLRMMRITGTGMNFCLVELNLIH